MGSVLRAGSTVREVRGGEVVAARKTHGRVARDDVYEDRGGTEANPMCR